MELKIHLVTSIVLAIALYPFLGWISVFVIVGGFLVDFDHYIDYVLVSNDWSLKKAIRHFRKGVFHMRLPILHIFHTIESFFVILILAVYFSIFRAVLLGFLLHMLLDLAHAIYYDGLSHRTNSILFWLFKSRKRN